MRQRIILLPVFLFLIPPGLSAQKDSIAAKVPVMQSMPDSSAAPKPGPVSASAGVIDSSDEYNFLELYYYGPDYQGIYDVYDPWDIYPDQEGDSRERDNDSRDSQERDAREE
ncbi:MAG: hypothetical protein A2509_02150 [Candidatus Edwardsbacteria bacterium RIFOXYD12_FULL_50_11]|uniref:Uncharacterized protein n=1 Tax=Candidatus Edwardsbacteria bacterium GWF2_54_11 TaxID=1817851 RepID=A0A1F5RBI2_9BACT|nr:MAG: hypothetical protein A2502_06015 [Candidatus Edwardsbacteria bacterium RifOxyC12_full_54_24]OGF07135.1 MAG: hypothetical protein A2273_09415 [Candidatus Edwardsbacteria bacterium RifOxyA12_full_54_48]OGF10899.1 MAG: hypothetical protein A3K15_07095 [Candidatus Edwardsbacteria bacterium GWE2_54_12]OGF11810.1 MAG: hypothetical protein A2024_12390 [Candidatus Edwardsbacteria bacterium GWF2_54_11]OGF15845.1 MAG: hypothetical protein A2509_02150 [Candidatus Edwardsbacteria bacterium RIFOXYD1